MDQKSETRQAILECGSKLLQEKGYHGWSYDDISKSVGVRKASIHYYFPKKEDLGKELVIQYHKKVMSFLEEEETKTPKEKLARVIHLFASVLENPALFCLCGMLAADLPTLAPEIVKELSLFFTALEHHVEKILKKGKFTHSPAFEAKSFIASLEGMLLLSRMQGGKSHFEAMANNYASKWGL